MIPDSYLRLSALIVILSWWPIIILFYFITIMSTLLFVYCMERNYTTIFIYLFQILSSVSTFFSIVMLQYVHLWHKKTLFIKREWSITITE